MFGFRKWFIRLLSNAETINVIENKILFETPDEVLKVKQFRFSVCL